MHRWEALSFGWVSQSSVCSCQPALASQASELEPAHLWPSYVSQVFLKTQLNQDFLVPTAQYTLIYYSLIQEMLLDNSPGEAQVRLTCQDLGSM